MQRIPVRIANSLIFMPQILRHELLLTSHTQHDPEKLAFSPQPIVSYRAFTTSRWLSADNGADPKTLSQEADITNTISQGKEKQVRTPWHREGSDVPPVRRQRSAGAITKGNDSWLFSQRRRLRNESGKLLTTPSRLLKLILPLTTHDHNSDRKDIEPLALLVHPQQPLSYLERLIQSELPSVKNAKGEEKVPAVYFKAEDSAQDELTPKTKTPEEEAADATGDGLEEIRFDEKIEKTGKLNSKSKDAAVELRGGPGEGGVESYSGKGQEADPAESRNRKFVRWSTSTEIGDFIRDAARGSEFAVEIEGAPHEIRVGVPSFSDRTHYLRTRLRKTSRKIADMAAIKDDCDVAAHRGAQRVAIGGFGGLVAWWYVVYRLTFETDL